MWVFMQIIIIQSFSSGPNRKGLLLYYYTNIFFFVWRFSISFFNFVFSSFNCCNFWFIMVLLLDFKIERSLTLFFNPPICSSNYFIDYCFLSTSLWSYWFLSVNFFLNISSSFSLSFKLCICAWYWVILYPFF